LFHLSCFRYCTAKRSIRASVVPSGASNYQRQIAG
jgi:hypothetical protein